METLPPSAAPAQPRAKAISLAVLGALLAALLLAILFTHPPNAPLELSTPPVLPSTDGLVDQSPLRTARQLAEQAAVPGERQFASDALRLADNEVDQAFATELRNAAEHPQPLTGEALQVSRRIAEFEQRIATEQAGIQKAAAAHAKPEDGGGSDPRLQLAQAQLALDQDELDDLQQDLLRLGGQRRNLLEQALSEHEAIQSKAADLLNGPNVALETPETLRTLPGKFRAYASLRSRAAALAQAQADAQALGRVLGEKHAALEHRAETEAAAPAQDPAAGKGLADLRAMGSDRKSLAEYDRRIRQEGQLADVYGRWRSLVLTQQKVVLYRILRVCAGVLLIVALMVSAGHLIRRLLHRLPLERRQRHTLRLLLTLLVQAAAVFVIVVVLFGTPAQMPTILGLATAGLTVALKDFVIAFVGWFVLMGRNGVRTGDWVEIDGVSGEVVELGLLRTVLLETGKWTDSGRPTGRRVAFMNGYAIEGHFFNFSTAGQWLWDELRVTLPMDDDVYDKTEAIRQAVLEVTGESMQQAESDWQRATRRYGLRSFSAEPTVDLRPNGGVEVVVRYITRAPDRNQLRSQLYGRLLHILHGSESFAMAGAAGR